MKHANHTVTYFPLDKDGKTGPPVILRGVSWTHKTVSSAADKGALLSKVVVCRIPLENAPAGFVAKDGAMLVCGVLEAEGLTDASLKHQYGAVTVKAVSDNRDGLAPHWKLEAV